MSEDIVLTVERVAPGATLNNPSMQLARLQACVESLSSTSFREPQVATSSISGEVTCLVVPPAVTWTSGSGAFGAPLCAAPAVPTLASWARAVLTMVLIGMGLSVLRARHPEVI